MTIDEAISHAREVAECQKMSARLIEDNAYIPESVDKEAITHGNTICADEHEQLAEWLEELKQYRAIGTPEECRAAVEKKKTIKPHKNFEKFSGVWCSCGNYLGKGYFVVDKPNYCSDCGQKLDWSEEE